MESLAPPPVPGFRPCVIAAQSREGSHIPFFEHVVRAMKPEGLGLAFLPISTIRLLRVHEIASGCVVRGWPSLVKGAGLRILSRRGSQVQILPHASCRDGARSLPPRSIPGHRHPERAEPRNSRGHENRLDSRVESVGGGHHLQRHPRGRQSAQVRGGTSGSPNDRLARDGSVPSGRGPSHRVVDLSGAGARCAGPHNRTRDRFGVDRGAPVAAALFGYLAAALSLAHVFATTRAAPKLLKLRSGIPEEAVLADVYRAFTRWQTVRAILQLAAFVAVVLALASLAPLGQ